MAHYLLLIFLVCTFVQCLYFIAYIVSIGSHKSTKPSSHLGISVIICARNEFNNLGKNLPKILSQKYDSFEVIVVNDRSTDGSYDFLMEQKSFNPNLKVVQIDAVPDHINSKKYALTLGIKAAQYDNLLLTDADCYPNSDNWILTMSTALVSKTDFGLGVSLYEKRKGFLNIFIRFETWITAIQYIGNALLGKPYMGVGRNLTYKKDIFLNNKGFSEIQKITGGDDDLFVNKHATRKNTRVILGKDALVYTTPKTSWADFFRQKVRHMSVGRLYKLSDKIILGIFSLTHIMFWITAGIAAYFEPNVVMEGFLMRLLFMISLFYTASKKFGKRFIPLILPVLDFVYVIYYISAATRAAFSKNIRWS